MRYAPTHCHVAAAWDSNPDVQRASDGALHTLLGAFPDLEKARKLGNTDTRGKGPHDGEMRTRAWHLSEARR